MYFCYKCKNELNIRGAVGRENRCLNCQSYIHCCSNCRSYDPRDNRCCDPDADRVNDCQEKNYCDHFSLKDYIVRPSDHKEEVLRARERLEALFRKKN